MIKPLLSMHTPLFSQTAMPEISPKITGFEETPDNTYKLEFSAKYKGSYPAKGPLKSTIDEKNFHRPETEAFQHLLLRDGAIKENFNFTGQGIKSLVKNALFFSISGRICIFDTKALSNCSTISGILPLPRRWRSGVKFCHQIMSNYSCFN